MNWAEFKDPVSHVCLAGTVVACCFVIQEEAGSNTQILQNSFRKNSIKPGSKILSPMTKSNILF